MKIKRKTLKRIEFIIGVVLWGLLWGTAWFIFWTHI